MLYAQRNSQPKYERYQFDANAVLGSLPNMTEDELHNRLVQAVEEGMFNISIASSITFETPEAMGEARKEVVVTFKPPAHVPTGFKDSADKDKLILQIKPGREVGEAYKFLLELRLDEGPQSPEAAEAALRTWWAERRASEG